METAPTPARGGRGVIWAIIVIVVALVAWWRLSPAPAPRPDAGLSADAGPMRDAAAAKALPADGGALGRDARPDGAEVVVDARIVETAATPDARIERRRRRSRRRDAGGHAPKPSPRDAGVVSPRPSTIRDAAPPKKTSLDAAVPKAPAVEGPRARAGAEQGTVRVDGAPAGRRWRPITGRGVLIDAEGPAGPRVRTRVLERGGRFVSTITAKPFGQIFVDGRPMGESPKAGIPLREGRSTIAVRTADGHETRLTVELSH